MGFCQILMLCIFAMSLGLNLAKHGEPRTGKYSFWVSLISSAIELSVLYFGGFFG